MQLEIEFEKKLSSYQKRIYEMVGKGWYSQIGDIFDSDYMKNLNRFIADERSKNIIQPQNGMVLKAFELCPYENLSVVILGQDPYPDVNNNADGLAFSCANNVQPSLSVILKTLNKNYDPKKPYTLDHWAKQGVLLLNTALTVRAGYPGSHSTAWSFFTKNLIYRLGQRKDLVWLLWGSAAKRYARYINSNFIIEDNHPVAQYYSPGDELKEFFGGFITCNNYLFTQKKNTIEW